MSLISNRKRPRDFSESFARTAASGGTSGAPAGHLMGSDYTSNLLSSSSSTDHNNIAIHFNDSIVIDMLAFYELEDITLLLETNRPNEPLTYGISISMDSNREKQCANYTGETHIKNYKIDEKWV